MQQMRKMKYLFTLMVLPLFWDYIRDIWRVVLKCPSLRKWLWWQKLEDTFLLLFLLCFTSLLRQIRSWLLSCAQKYFWTFERFITSKYLSYTLLPHLEGLSRRHWTKISRFYWVSFIPWGDTNSLVITAWKTYWKGFWASPVLQEGTCCGIHW